MVSLTKPTLTVLPALIALAGVILVVGHSQSTHGLRAETTITQSETGIPGISKWYEATITNRGVWRVVVTRCNAVDDAGGKETMLAYGVERWNQGASRWDSVMAFDASNFCKPYPLGIVEAHLNDWRLWPGQSLSTGPEITAARFHKGDVARFVVFTAAAGDYHHCVATKGFVIDQEIEQTGIDFRIRH